MKSLKPTVIIILINNTQKRLKTHPNDNIIDFDTKCLLCCEFELGEEHGSNLDRREGLLFIQVAHHNASASVW